jgi:hypothetical protein
LGGLLNRRFHGIFLVALRIIAGLTGDDERFIHLRMGEIAMTSLSTPVDKTGLLQIPDQLPNFYWHFLISSNPNLTLHWAKVDLHAHRQPDAPSRFGIAC